MRTQLISLAVAAAILQAPRLNGQAIPRTVGHNSAEAVARVMANAQVLHLTAAQNAKLSELQSVFTRRETRLIRAGWVGTPGRAGIPAFKKIRIAPRPELYTEVRTENRLLALDRVPGKAVPRLERTRVIRLVQQPCPFTFLASDQLAKAHEFLVQ